MPEATPNITKIPAPRVPLMDQRTGLISREWFRFFNNIYVITGGNTQGVTQIINGGTGASTAAQARENLGAGTVTKVIGTGYASGLELVGEVTTEGTISLQGNVIVSAGEITGTIDLATQVSGQLDLTTHSTGTIDLATQVSGQLDLTTHSTGTIDAATQVTGVLPVANGGTGLSARPSVATKTADFTVADTEGWLINNKSGSSCTVTLPTAADWPGRQLVFKNIQAQTLVSASSNVVPLSGGAAGTAILPASVGAWATLVSDGTNWVIMQS